MAPGSLLSQRDDSLMISAGSVNETQYSGSADFSLSDIATSEAAGVLIILTIIVLCINVTGAVIINLYNDFPPIKAKRPLLTAMEVFGSIFWCIGSLSTYHLIRQYQQPSQSGVCIVMDVLMGMTLGIFVFVTSIFLRCWSLLCAFKYGRAATNLPFLGTLMMFPSIVILFICTVVPDKTVTYDDVGRQCKHSEAFRGLQICIGITFLVAIGALFVQLRRHVFLKAFNERIQNTALLVILALQIVFQGLATNDQITQQWQDMPTLAYFLVLVLLTASLWMRIGAPIYGFFFRREMILQEFELSLRRPTELQEQQL
eukprot:jgi/Hompol1/5177/HPOL_001229-RA